MKTLLCLALVGYPLGARAEQRELQIALQPVYGLTYVDERTPSGGGGGAQVSYGITDAVSVQLEGGLTAHPLAADMTKMLPAGMLLAWNAYAGVVYSLDIVRIVPYFEAAIGVLGVTESSSKGPQTSVNLGAAVGLGADYMINRRWAVGIALRYHAVVTNLSQLPMYLTAGPRVVLRFGL